MTMTPEGSLGDAPHGRVQRPAQPLVAHSHDVAQRVVDVYAHQGRQGGIQVALDQRDVHGLVDVILIAKQLESAVFGLDAILVDALHRALVLQADSGSDPRWCRSSGRAIFANSSRSGRRAMVPSSFRISTIMAAGENPARSRQIAARLGVPGPRQHAAGLRHQRKYVPRLTQILRPAHWVPPRS